MIIKIQAWWTKILTKLRATSRTLRNGQETQVYLIILIKADSLMFKFSKNYEFTRTHQPKTPEKEEFPGKPKPHELKPTENSQNLETKHNRWISAAN